MAGAFHGAAVITLDAKGRIAIPTRHRGALLDGGGALVLTAHPDGCVLIYPEAAWEPVRSRVVLNIMDGLRGVWHAGPFSRSDRFRFYPKLLMFGTDPIAMDHKLLELIEAKRKAEGAVSLFDRAPERLSNSRNQADPNFNAFIREPGHIEYATKFGLGIYDQSRIKIKDITL